MQRLSSKILLGSAVFLLVGCGGGASEMMGLGRHSPDEFAVVDRAPLSLPPDYDLRPPRPGAMRPQEIKMTDRASKVLFGERKEGSYRPPVKDLSESEQFLLKSAGAEEVAPNIRETIDREADQRVVGSSALVDELLWWKDEDYYATTVDPVAESERLREAKKEGKAVNDKPTPIIEKNRSGWLF